MKATITRIVLTAIVTAPFVVGAIETNPSFLFVIAGLTTLVHLVAWSARNGRKQKQARLRQQLWQHQMQAEYYARANQYAAMTAPYGVQGAPGRRG